jgi:hypothetical protein
MSTDLLQDFRILVPVPQSWLSAQVCDTVLYMQLLSCVYLYSFLICVMFVYFVSLYHFLFKDKALSQEAMEVLRPVVRRLAMHVVAAKPAYLDESAVPEEVFMHTLAFNNITLFIVS